MAETLACPLLPLRRTPGLNRTAFPFLSLLVYDLHLLRCPLSFRPSSLFTCNCSFASTLVTAHKSAQAGSSKLILDLNLEPRYFADSSLLVDQAPLRTIFQSKIALHSLEPSISYRTFNTSPIQGLLSQLTCIETGRLLVAKHKSFRRTSLRLNRSQTITRPKWVRHSTITPLSCDHEQETAMVVQELGTRMTQT